jgi:hypothetical protein
MMVPVIADVTHLLLGIGEWHELTYMHSSLVNNNNQSLSAILFIG